MTDAAATANLIVATMIATATGKQLLERLRKKKIDSRKAGSEGLIAPHELPYQAQQIYMGIAVQILSYPAYRAILRLVQ